MSILQAIVLGIVQGLTEFLPISSTAHLILVERALGWQFDKDLDFAFNILIQLGTTVAVVLYFARDLWAIARDFILGLIRGKPTANPNALLGWLIIIATIPAVVAGLLFKDTVKALHEQPVVVALILILASLILFGSERLGRRTRPLSSANWLDAAVIGCAQALALLPGVSRSGATIAGGLVRNLDRSAATRISFLMSIPALTGAAVLSLRDLLKVPDLSAFLPPMLAGFIVAGIVGFASIRWLLAFLAHRSLDFFGWYRIVAGVVFLVLLVSLGR